MTTTELEKYFGTPNKAAEFFGVSPEAFYQWRKRPGNLIPKGRAAEAASVEWIGKHSQYLRKATADGVIDDAERAQIEENSYQVMAKWQEHLTLLFRVFCAPEKSDARECAAPGVLACRISGETNA